jgi:hypothetical protein
MPYKIRKQKCKQSDGDSGTYVLSYTDKKGKKHRNCHTSKKKAQGQIAAIEMEGVEPVESIHDLLREDASVPNRVRIEYTREDIEQFLESLLNEGTLKPPQELVDAMTQWTNEQLFDSVTPYINRAIKGCEEVLKLFRSLPDYPGDKNSGVVTRYFESGATVDKVGFYELLINDDLTYGGSPDHAIETYADTLRQLQDLRKWLDSLGSSSTRRTPQHKQSYRSKELVTAPAGAPDMDEAVAAAIYDAFMRAEPRYTKSLPKDYATALGTFNDLIMDTMSIIEGLGQYGAKIPPKKGIILSMVRLLQAIPTRLEAGAVVVPHGAPSKHGDFSPAGGSYRVRTFMREYLHPDRIKARMKEARASMRDYAGYTRQYADQTPPKYGLALNGAGKPIPPPTEKMAQLAGELALVNYLIARGGIDMRYLEDEIKDMLSRSSGVAKHELTHAMQAFGSTLIAMSRIADVLGTVRDRAKDLGLSVADLSSSCLTVVLPRRLGSLGCSLAHRRVQVASTRRTGLPTSSTNRFYTRHLSKSTLSTRNTVT